MGCPVGADQGLTFSLKVIRMTGFMKGLYTDAEMKSDNVKVGPRGSPGPACVNAALVSRALRQLSLPC